MIECSGSKNINKVKVSALIDDLVNSAPGNAYLLLDTRKQKNKLDALISEQENMGASGVGGPHIREIIRE